MISRRDYKRAYQREYRRRIGGGSGGSRGAKDVGGDIRGMEGLFQAIEDLRTSSQIKVRRAALKETANQLVKPAKQAATKYDVKPEARAVLRRAIFRQDPKTVERVGVKGKGRRAKPMRYRVAVRQGRQEEEGASLGAYKSGKRKGESKGTRKLNRNAYWWVFFEKGTKSRFTKRGLSRGKIWEQGHFKKAFDAAGPSAIAKGEQAGLKAAQKEIARLRAKAKKPKA